jgi:hypothetical protein
MCFKKSRITHLYCDETKCNKKTFEIISVIWGDPVACAAYEHEINLLVRNNLKILGKDFKGFHSNKVNDENWGTVGKILLEVLKKLFEFVHDGKLNIKIIFVGSNKYNDNIGYLKDLIKKELENRNSPIGKHFKSLKDTDLPALYHRIDQLFVYLLYRDKFGSEGDKFKFFPDSSGKILNYAEKEFEVSGNLQIKYPMKFFTLICVLGNALSKVIRLNGWPVIKQELVLFKPLKWSSSYLIQSCDILSNFSYNFIRYHSGQMNESYKLKAQALSKHFLLNELEKEISKIFQIDDADVICIDPTLLATIDPII